MKIILNWPKYKVFNIELSDRITPKELSDLAELVREGVNFKWRETHEMLDAKSC